MVVAETESTCDGGAARRRDKSTSTSFINRVFTTCVYWPSLKRYSLHKTQIRDRIQPHIWSVAGSLQQQHQPFENMHRTNLNRQRKTLKVGFSVAARYCCQINCCISDKSICDFLLLVRVVVVVGRVFNWDVVCWWICFSYEQVVCDGDAWTFFPLIKCRFSANAFPLLAFPIQHFFAFYQNWNFSSTQLSSVDCNGLSICCVKL